MCWVMGFKIVGIGMIFPTLLLAIILTYKRRKDIDDVFHNLAICCWILANSIWMIGEFYFHDTIRDLSIVVFSVGFVVLFYYYFAKGGLKKLFSN